MRDGLPRQDFRLGAGALDAKDTDETRLTGSLVLRGGLAHGRGVALDIEKVVSDLEGEADILAVADDRLTLGLPCAAENGAGLTREDDQRAGLEPLKPCDGVEADLFALAVDVDHLTADHAGMAGRDGETLNQFGPNERIGVDVHRRHKLEGEALQGVAGEYRRRFVIFAMKGWLPAAQIVVVHARQVVMDQRIGMQAFDRRCRAGERGSIDTEESAGLERHEGTKALAAAEGCVAHGTDEPRLKATDRRQIGIERLFHQHLGFGERGVDGAHGANPRRACRRPRAPRPRPARSFRYGPRRPSTWSRNAP